MNRSHEEIFQIRTYETGVDGKLKISSIVNYLQELASLHASDLNFSVDDLWPKKLTWVLAKYHIKIKNYPMWMDKVKVITWPSGFESLYANREFEIFDQNENLLISASSNWLLINIETKRPVRPSENLGEMEFIKRKGVETEIKPIPKIEQPDHQLTFRARMNDLDMNHHVNNELYIEWALETIPVEYLSVYEPYEIEVAFKKEAFYGDIINSLSETKDNSNFPVFEHNIVREGDSAELARLRTKWRKKVN